MGVSCVIITMEHVAILDKTESLAKMIVQSEVMHEYRQAYEAMKNDETAQKLIREFEEAKELYEQVQRFGRYHPDYTEIMKKVRAVKREMDMHPLVYNFKLKERESQRFLDDISELIARSVSQQIIVPRDDRHEPEACSSGGCGTGGACSCSA